MASDPEIAEGADGEDAVDEQAYTIIPWDGKVLDASRALRVSGASYGNFVITSRALPDIRDGFKPVQRRIIYSMIEQRMYHNQATKKCGKICGEVMGNYHPHGDVSIYGALVRMAQPFSSMAPLIEGQGNFGTRGPKAYSDPQAAMRYTEARLSPLGSSLGEDLRPEIISFKPNYDESRQEPDVVPVTFPNLLVNGTEGIAWGMASSIPPHNLGEAIDAAILVAQDPMVTLKQVMKKLPAPDFPTQGVIVAPDGFEEMYRTGRGKFFLQGKWHVEQLKSGQALVIDELPYGVSARQVKAKIVEEARKGKITEITRMPNDESTRKGIRLVVEVKRGGDMAKLISQVLQHTPVRIPRSGDFTVLVDGAPHSTDLMAILHTFVLFRREIITNRLQHERDVLMRQLHRLIALRAALDVIDKVIKIIRGAKDDDDARQQLMALIKVTPYGTKKKVAIDAEQAQYILDMPLKRLNQLNQFQLDEEINGKETRIAEIDRILGDDKLLVDLLVSELREVRKAHAIPRQSELADIDFVAEADAEGNADGLLASTGPVTPVTLAVAIDGRAIAVERKRIKAVPLALSGAAKVVTVMDCQSDEEMIVFTSAGSCQRLRVAELPIERKKGRGTSWVQLEKGETVVCVLPASVLADGFFVFATAGGLLKRIPAEILKNAHAGGIAAFGVPSGDRIVAALHHGEGAEILLHSRKGKVLRTGLDALRPVKTGSAGGVAGMKLAAGDEVVSGMLASDGDTMIVLHEAGHGKAVAASEYPSKGRGGGGVESAKTNAPAKDPAGDIVLAMLVPSGATIDLVSATGQMLIDLDTSQIPTGARAAVSRHVIEFGPGDHAVTVYRKAQD